VLPKWNGTEVEFSHGKNDTPGIFRVMIVLGFAVDIFYRGLNPLIGSNPPWERWIYLGR